MRHPTAMLRLASLALSCLCLYSSTATAQTRTALPPDTRVRLTLTTPELIRVLTGSPLTASQSRRTQFIGTLQGRRDDDVVIRVRDPEAELAVPLRSVARLETSLGRHGKAGQGALIGFGVGMVGGIATGLIACSGGDCDEGDSFFDPGTGFVTAVLALGGAIVGTGVGAITGALIRSERWQPVQIPDLPQGEGPPVENGIRLAISLPLAR